MRSIKSIALSMLIGLALVLTFTTVRLLRTSALFRVFAEQVGSSPESGVDSLIKQAYDFLVSKGTNYGGVSSPEWSNDWGTIWNRIMNSALWEPDDATANPWDVDISKTIYSDTRTSSTAVGTALMLPGGYSPQQYVEWDDYKGGSDTSEESSWTQTATNVWRDNRTGLYWTSKGGYYSNNFSMASCDFFSTTPRGDYNGLDSDCGDAINHCGTLSLVAVTGEDARTDWYLPSNKELLQAGVNGMYNQAGSTFTGTEFFWSSTESSLASTDARYVYIDGPGDGANTKTDSGSCRVRCVRRD